MGSECLRSGKHGGLAVDGDLPDEVSGSVGDVSVAREVDGDVVGDRTVVGCGGVVEEGEEEASAIGGSEVVGGEGVEGGERREGVEDGEEAAAEHVDGDAEDGGVGGKGGVGDEGVDDGGVGDGEESAVAEGTDDEVLGRWVPGEGLRVEVGGSEIDDVGFSGESWAHKGKEEEEAN